MQHIAVALIDAKLRVGEALVIRVNEEQEDLAGLLIDHIGWVGIAVAFRGVLALRDILDRRPRLAAILGDALHDGVRLRGIPALDAAAVGHRRIGTLVECGEDPAVGRLGERRNTVAFGTEVLAGGGQAHGLAIGTVCGDGGRIGALAFLHGDGIAGGDDVVLQHLSAPSVRGGLPHGTRGEAAGREIIRSDGVAGRGARVGSASRKVLITAVRRSCGQHTAQIRLGGECGECRTRVVGVGETVGERVTDIYLVAEGVGTRHRDGEHVSIIAGRTRGGYPCGQYHQHGSGRHQRAKTAQQRWLGRMNHVCSFPVQRRVTTLGPDRRSTYGTAWLPHHQALFV